MTYGTNQILVPDDGPRNAKLVLVCGSRTWNNGKAIRDRLLRLPSDAVVMHGGCRGADHLASVAAKHLKLRQQVYSPNWALHGRAAGPIRNQQMIDAQPDLVLAFTNDLEASKGTRNTVELARCAGIPVEVISE